MVHGEPEGRWCPGCPNNTIWHSWTKHCPECGTETVPESGMLRVKTGSTSTSRKRNRLSKQLLCIPVARISLSAAESCGNTTCGCSPCPKLNRSSARLRSPWTSAGSRHKGQVVRYVNVPRVSLLICATSKSSGAEPYQRGSPAVNKEKCMTLLRALRPRERSGSIPATSGGCGGLHTRPVNRGTPVKTWELACAPV